MNLSSIDWERWSAPALSGLRILLIIALAWVAIGVLQGAARAVRRRVEIRMGEAEGSGRAATLGGYCAT